MSQGFNDWVAVGRPYRLIRPAADLQRILRSYGLTVYDYPDGAHQKANTPEDHTPYSVTGWPGTNKRWRARALDVMPRSKSFEHRKENADIARRLIRDRDAGVPGTLWIKYINWTDENGVCTRVSWKPHHDERGSTDRDHVHISGRSDMDDWAGAATYDPLGEDMSWEQVLINGKGIKFRADAWLMGANEAAWTTLSVAQALHADLKATSAADELRDKAMMAAIQALAVGGGADAALQAIREVQAEAREQFAALQGQIATLTAQRDRLQAELDAARRDAEPPEPVPQDGVPLEDDPDPVD